MEYSEMPGAIFPIRDGYSHSENDVELKLRRGWLVRIDNHLDYDKIEYNSQYDLIEQVYFEWFEDINTMYLDVKNGLLKLI